MLINLIMDHVAGSTGAGADWDVGIFGDGYCNRDFVLVMGLGKEDLGRGEERGAR